MNNLNNFAVSPMQSRDGFSKKFFISGDKMYQSVVTERVATEVSARKLQKFDPSALSDNGISPGS